VVRGNVGQDEVVGVHARRVVTSVRDNQVRGRLSAGNAPGETMGIVQLAPDRLPAVAVGVNGTRPQPTAAAVAVLGDVGPKAAGVVFTERGNRLILTRHGSYLNYELCDWLGRRSSGVPTFRKCKRD